jgi:hypothetical protein
MNPEPTTATPAPLALVPRRPRRARRRQPGRFAATTKVPVDRSRGEIERLVRKHGATAFASADDGEKVAVAFKVGLRQVRWQVPLPTKSRYRDVKVYEQDVRRLWRSLLLAIKARLVAVEAGVEMFDTAFLSYIVTSRGMTVGELIAPQLDSAVPQLDSADLPALPDIVG